MQSVVSVHQPVGALAFEPHLRPGERLWTGHVSKDFRHSSLFFYLDRPVETFSAGHAPAVGDHVVFFSEEHRRLMAATPFDYEVVERGARRGVDFFLARVTARRLPAEAKQ